MPQLEDPGTLAQIGYSAGSRSKPFFDWVKNLLSRRFGAKQVYDLNYKTSSAFAAFWNACQAWLPPEILQDMADFMEATNIPSMEASKQFAARTGTYSVVAKNVEFKFSNALLTPPAGVMARNYTRYCTSIPIKMVTRVIHKEYQPHEWAISWTTCRTGDESFEGAFYMAKYGIHVAGATNTLVAWKPQDFHGTSLQKVDPLMKHPLSRRQDFSLHRQGMAGLSKGVR